MSGRRGTMRGGRKGQYGGYIGYQPAKELAVYLNPYSSRTQAPKIPDGSRNYSLGVSYRSQWASVLNANNIFLFLVPGFKTYFYAMNTESTAPITGSPAGIAEHTVVAGATQQDPIAVTPVALQSWRGVSFGMKVKTTNNYDKNSGWWQAVRIRPCDRFQTVANGVHYPVIDDSFIDTSVWPNDPSFSSGRLADVHRKDFVLATENDEHLWLEMGSDGLTAQSSMIDNSFDIICVSINGVANETALLIDIYANYEHTYRKDSGLNKFQTHSAQVLPSVLAMTQQRKRRKCVKAAS